MSQYWFGKITYFIQRWSLSDATKHQFDWTGSQQDSSITKIKTTSKSLLKTL